MPTASAPSAGASVFEPLQRATAVAPPGPVVALVLCLAALAAGCAVLPVTRPVLKLGLVGPFQGPYRYAGYDAIYAARLALQEANAQGGVGGFNVELVAYDDQGTADGARQAARSLILDSQVVAVVGHFRDETTAAARELYAGAGLPLVATASVEGTPGLGEDATGLWCPLLLRLQEALAPGDAVFWLGEEGLAADAARTCGADLRITPDTGGDPLSLPPDAAAAILVLDPAAAAEALLALRDAGWEGIVAGGPALGSPLFTQVVDPSGVIFVSPYRWPALDGEDAAFAAAYRALGPHVPSPGPLALSTYEASQRVLEAIAMAGEEGAVDRTVLARHLSAPAPGTPGPVFFYRWATAERLEPLD